MPNDHSPDLSCRECNSKGTASPDCAFHMNRPAVRPDGPLRNRQSEAEASVAARSSAVASVKPFEYAIKVHGVDARAGIRNSDGQFALAALSHGHFYCRLRRRILHRIMQNIDYRLPDENGVETKVRIILDFKLDLLGLFFCERLQKGYRIAYNAGD